MLTIDLTGKSAVLTGATGQLGRVMARTLAACGANLVLQYHRDTAQAELLVRELRTVGSEKVGSEKAGRQVVSVQADVGTQEGVHKVQQAAQAAVGAPEIVVINAVQQIHPWSTVLEESLEDYESQFRTCVMQSVHLAKAFVPGMQRSGWGRIVGVNTECTMQMLETQSAYVAGKRGMDGVLRVLAREIGKDGITVNQVAPGWTVSDRDRQTPPDDAKYCEGVPLRRRGTDQEVANVVAFLASELASFVHGAFVPVCGGNVMPAV